MSVWFALLVSGAAAGSEGPLRFDRIDVLSDNSARFLADDLPRIGFAPAATSLRFASQITAVLATEHIEIASSLSTQALGLRAPLVRDVGVWVDGGLIARGLLPAGVRGGLALRRGPLRVGFALCAESAVSWTDLSWFGPDRVLLRPALGIGFGRDLRGRAPWM